MQRSKFRPKISHNCGDKCKGQSLDQDFITDGDECNGQSSARDFITAVETKLCNGSDQEYITCVKMHAKVKVQT